MLKMDVQGYQLEGLAGARQTLAQCDFVLLELPLIQMSRGAPLISEVISFMAERGLRLYDIRSLMQAGAGRVLSQMDGLSVSEHSPLLRPPGFYPSVAGRLFA